MPFLANESFISFNHTGQRELPIDHLHVFADKASHAPSRLIGHTKLPFQFLGRNAVTGRCEQINGIEPQAQGRPAVLKRRPDCRVKVMPAPLAGIGPFRLKTIPVRLFAAFRAGMALTKSGIKQMLQANFVRGELLHELNNRHAGRVFLAVLNFHAPNIC